jgi:hypothetical protein
MRTRCIRIQLLTSGFDLLSELLQLKATSDEKAQIGSERDELTLHIEEVEGLQRKMKEDYSAKAEESSQRIEFVRALLV